MYPYESKSEDEYCREVLKSALALAKQGIRVFPLKYRSKEPLHGSHGCKDATTNPAKIQRWFGGRFRYNLAVATGQASKVWVLDVDDPGALEALEAKHGQLPLTRQSRSSRGLHLWWRTTVLPVPCSAGRIGDRIDARGEGGYVAVPPSVHPEGVVYHWVDPDTPIVPAPSWLLGLARKPEPPQQPSPRRISPQASAGLPGGYGAAALRAEIAMLAAAPRGSRNHTLNRVSFCLFQLVAGGELNASDVERELLIAAAANGLLAEDGERQCLATIRSGAFAGRKSPRTRNGRAA